ncbi:hypothetical protein SeMB42_g06030 [Synchytrium endobioticum]|uniref:tRNA (guanine(9)-N1)-methyltransferase n=1 Tax=Synchytrium endobioticum TaxID=286115 RepID=A0A507CU81_9FUNG|nr:hypothetical protein SeMB42_g06030 [Synchytrium endobioticum]TPX42658.1 hypothetical protein SeLEV6574_g05472 [Synchytrium endobioticum]
MHSPSDTANDSSCSAAPAPSVEDASNQTQHQATQPAHPTSALAEPPGLSKKAQKRWIKEQRWKARKEANKEKNKEKKQARREQILRLKAEGKPVPPELRLKKRKPQKSTKPSPLTICIDMSFEDLMTDKELSSLCRQVEQGYGKNRSAERPVTMTLSSLGPKTVQCLDARCCSWKNWKVTCESKSALEIFDKDKLVYLTADSPNVLMELDETNVYIVGGIVDRNRYKNICYDRATVAGIAHGQLPIGEYISMASRKVLTTNQVIDIMLKYLEYKDWRQAFMEVIPARKGWKVLGGDRPHDGSIDKCVGQADTYQLELDEPNDESSDDSEPENDEEDRGDNL